MAASKSKATGPKAEQISDILKVTHGHFDCCIIGKTPLICNRLSEKAQRELLLPRGRKTAVEKAMTLKHNPVEEFRRSPYLIGDDSAPTFVAGLSVWFKAAMMAAALDMPGVKKAQIGRLVHVMGERVPVFGVPRLFMAIVRSADMNRTPDVRSRALFPEWACRITVSYVEPLIKPQAVANLLAAAGITAGVGDWRTQKGSGDYGQFEIVAADDPNFTRILKAGGRAAQMEAFETPVCHDDETADLLSWFDEEVANRKLKGVA